MSMKTRRSVRRGLSLLLSLVMLLSLLAPAVTASEQWPDSDTPSTTGEVYDEDTPSTDDTSIGEDPGKPSVTDLAYDSDMPPVTDALPDAENLSVNEAVYTRVDYAADSFAGGAGTVGEPYQIADGSQLAYLAQLVNSGARDTVSGETYAEKVYVLTGDIDLSTHPWTPIGQNEDGYEFTGTFDGANKTVSGLNINEETTDYIGLFGVIGAGGLVKDLTLSGANVSGKRYVGTVAGKIEAAVVENVYLVNCSVTAAGTTSGAAPGADAGVLIGRAEGVFAINSNRVTRSTVTASSNYVGGILGNACGSGTVCSCTVSDSRVETTGSYAGGICGYMTGGSAKYEPEISRCGFTGSSVEAGGFYTGGIVGECESYKQNAVRECYVDADIASSMAGGIIGRSAPIAMDTVIAVDCYSAGTVTNATSSQAGGIVGGGLGGIIKNCYSTARISAQSIPGGIGGLTYKTSSCVALNPSVTTYDRSIQGVGRIYVNAFSEAVQNYAFSGMPVLEGTKLIYVPSATRTQSGMNGEDVTYDQLTGGSFFTGLGWSSSVWNLEAGKLPTLKNLPTSVDQPDAFPDYLSGSIDWTIQSFAYLTPGVTVHFGTTRENIGLPAELNVTLADGWDALIPVTWSTPDYTAMPGVYPFTAVLPADCDLTPDAELPVIAVTVTNQAPQVKTPVPTQAITGTGTESFDAAEIARDEDGDPLTITGVVTAPDAAVATAVLDNGTVTVTRVALGTATVVVTVSDGAATVDVAVPITVANDAPVAKSPVPTRVVTDTGTGRAGTFVAADIAQDEEGDPLTITGIVTAPNAGIATAALDSGSGTVTVTGVAQGETTVVVRVSDGADTVDVSVPVTVSANRAPIAKASVPTQTIAGTGTKSFAAEEIAQDEDGDVLTITAIVTAPDAGIATVVLGSGNGTATLTGVGSGTTTMVVKVSDGGATADVTVPVTVSAGSWEDFVSASFAGGTGTTGDPYQIADAGQLAYLAQLVNSGAVDIVNDDGGKTYAQKAYRLTGNIDLSGHFWTAIGQKTDESKFTGSFDGDNRTISGLHVDETTGYVGLFGVIGAGGSVQNLTLSGAGVNGKNYIGAVAGKIEAAVVENVHLINSSVTATSSYSGGLVGRAEGAFIINNCTIGSSSITSSGSNMGGILGYAAKTGGVVASCTVFNSQVETSGSYAGGICGCVKDSTEIFRCSFTDGSVSGKGSVGGIAGKNDSDEDVVHECYVDAEISAASKAGSIVGALGSSASVMNCYAKGTVIASSNGAAGIANGGTVENCFSTAIVHARDLSGGIATSGNVSTSVALNPSVIGMEASSYQIGRVLSKSSSGSHEILQNSAFREMRFFEGGKLLYVPAADRMGNLKDGKDITYAELAGASSLFAAPPLSWDEDIWSLEAGKLPTLKNLPDPVVQSNDLPDHLSGSIDWTIKAFGYLTNSIKVDNGTTEANIGLPAELEVTLANGNQPALIPVTWSVPGAGYDAAPGVYPFTAALPGDCVLRSGVELPVITVTVRDNYCVTFDSRGGSEVAPVYVAGGVVIAQPTAPAREGFIFGGWYKDEACTQPWNFDTDMVTVSLTLYAKWSIDGTPDYTATQPGVQSADLSGKGFNDASIVRVSHIYGYITYAVVAEQNIEFWGPAGDYMIANSSMTMGSMRVTAFNQNPGDTPQERCYRGTGTVEDPHVLLGGFYTKDGSATSGTPLIEVTFRVWNLIAGYETEGKTYLGTPYSVLLEDRNMSTGRLNASFLVDGSKLLPSDANGWFRSPGSYGVALNPSDQIITGSFASHSLYSVGSYPDRLAAATSVLQAVRADSKKVLMYHTQTRDFSGSITHKLDVSGYFSEGDIVHINYLLGAANKSLYHGLSLDDDYMLALEPTYIKNNTTAVVSDGYITFDLYNGGYFELIKAEDDNSETKYVAEFTVNGGGDKLYPSTIYPQILSPEAKVTKPSDPLKAGHTFGGWYTDEDCTSAYDFAKPLTQHVILYAKWVKEGGDDPGGDVPGTTHTITFVTGKDPDTGKPNASIEEQSVKTGKKARDPGFFDSGYGYLVVAWYTDKGLTNEYDFDSEVTSNLTLYPEWMRYILKNDLKKEGGSGSQNDPYQAHLANSRQSKIAWKALNEIAGESEWWKVYVTKNNNSGGKELYSWVFNGEDIEKCNTAQPYYTDIALSKRSGGMQAKFVWRTAIEGKVYVNINVSDYFDDGTAVAISYVEGSCDGRVAHTDVESGEWVDSLHHPSTYYSGGSAVVENDFVTLELTHGGTYLLKADENARNNEKVGTAVEDPETGLVYINAEVEAKEGIATIPISDEALETVINTLVEKNENEIVIVPTITGEVSKIDIELTGSAVAGIIEKIPAVLVLKTDIGNVTVSNDMLAKIVAKENEKLKEGEKAKENEKGKEDAKVTFTIEKIAVDTVKFEIKLDDEVIDVSGGVRLAVPVEGAGDGMVAVLVKADGSEETIKKSVVNEGQLLTVLDGTATIRFVDRSRSFDDVDDSFWGQGAIAFATSHELFSGVSETEFAPNTSMTRGMLVSVLHRLAGTPAGGDIDYADIAEDAWYAEPVAWASTNGIASGTGRNFEPGNNVTREEIAAMMYQYAKLVGVDTVLQGDTAQFSDADQISDWAADAVSWAVGTGLLKGKDGDALDPRGEATRAEVAAMMQRLVNETMI